jgi:hypothetical protein
MRTSRVSVLLIVVVTAIAGIGALMAWDHNRLIYATPDTESAFLKNYSPRDTVKPFQMNESSGFSQHSGAGAGRDHVTRTAGFDLYFVSRSDLFTPLHDALIDDASKQLKANGATIIVRGVDGQGNYVFYYTLGHSIGSIKFFPVVAAPWSAHRKMPLPAGFLDTRAQIEQKEVWFPKPSSFDPVTFLASNQ